MKKNLTILIVLFSVKSWGQYTDLILPAPSPLVSSTIRIGVTDIGVEYSSPKANGRQIYGNIVPYTSDVPWRAGANSCTVVSFSTDVTIEGKPLKAGKYGLLMIPSERDAWTVIFSNNSDYWGGYYYNKAEDALRITVTPAPCNKRDELSYLFMESKFGSVTMALEWDVLRIPFKIEVNTVQNTLASLRRELSGTKGNNWYSWIAAARFCLRNQVNLEEALTWTDRAMNGGYGGYQATTNFMTLFVKHQVLSALGKTEAASEAFNKALPLLNNVSDYDLLASFYASQRKNELAIETYNKAIKLYPTSYSLYQDLGNLYVTLKDMHKALELYNASLPYVPAEYKSRTLSVINTLKAGK